jgi:hypothetical protein
LFIIAFI